MKPHTYKTRASWSAFFLYLTLLVLWVLALWWGGEPMWYLAFFPSYGFGLILLVKGETYRLEENQLFVKGLLEHKRISYDEIREVEVIQHPMWKRMLTGFPKESLKVGYQKYEEVWLHPRQPQELKQALHSRVEKQR